jgi:hypothetical protein
MAASQRSQSLTDMLCRSTDTFCRSIQGEVINSSEIMKKPPSAKTNHSPPDISMPPGSPLVCGMQLPRIPRISRFPFGDFCAFLHSISFRFPGQFSFLLRFLRCLLFTRPNDSRFRGSSPFVFSCALSWPIRLLSPCPRSHTRWSGGPVVSGPWSF